MKSAVSVLQLMQEVYELPDALCFRDVADLKDSKELKNLKIHVVTGGFPCQNLSRAGDRKGFRGAVCDSSSSCILVHDKVMPSSI